MAKLRIALMLPGEASLGAFEAGAVSALSGAPYGYRYIGRHEGGGIARFERCEDEARIVRLIFRWVGVDCVSLREVSRRLHKMGCATKTGKVHWGNCSPSFGEGVQGPSGG